MHQLSLLWMIADNFINLFLSKESISSVIFIVAALDKPQSFNFKGRGKQALFYHQVIKCEIRAYCFNKWMHTKIDLSSPWMWM